jgi:hypothetical protein
MKTMVGLDPLMTYFSRGCPLFRAGILTSDIFSFAGTPGDLLFFRDALHLSSLRSFKEKGPRDLLFFRVAFHLPGLDKVKKMAHFIPLGHQVLIIMQIDLGLQVDGFNNFKPVTFKPLPFKRIVCN